ncbi:O-antigen ligase family protein [Bacteroidota bacterium]|nr:O-antigen ligase family protein [Bacteroidota bacterium]
MSLVAKYGFIIFVFNSVLLSIPEMKNIGDFIFFGLMFIFSIYAIVNSSVLIQIFKSKSFQFMILIILINFFYWIIFHEFNDLDAIKYLSARSIQFFIICIAVLLNYEYFLYRFPKHLAYFVLILVFIGLVINPDFISKRYLGIFWNENAFASFTCMSFAVFFLQVKERTNLDNFLMTLLIIVSASTGSRSVVIALILCFLLKYGLSVRNSLYSTVFTILYLFIINLQLSTSFNRFSAVSLFDDRILQIKYAFTTLLNKPFFGYGIDKYSYIDMDLVPDLIFGTIISAHNGYLALLVQFGMIFGGAILFIIGRQSFLNIRRFISKQNNNTFYLFVLIFGLLTSFFETLITGINEFHTILFLFSLAILNFSYYESSDN